MAITWKILDANGPELTVKYTAADGRMRTVVLHWDGKTEVEQFVSRACPLTETPPQQISSAEHAGKEGTVTAPVFNLPPVPPKA